MSSSFAESLRERGWSYVAAKGDSSPWIQPRYHSLPNELVAFLESFSNLQSRDETQWFIAASDFSRDIFEGFAWNEFERISLDAAVGDLDWLGEIQSFWTAHIPIFMSVDGFCSYAAYCCGGENNGCYVSGSEPEFEEVRVVATDLSGFLAWVSNEINT